MKIVRASQITSHGAGLGKFTRDGVWRSDILTSTEDGLRANRFVYAPGHRSNWHVHDGEQALIVLDGRGLIQWEGLETARILWPGDWVHVSPGVAHWHGAAPDEVFVHVAVTASGPTRWLHAVDDHDYRGSLPDDV